MKEYITEKVALGVAMKQVKLYLDNHRSQFANISVPIVSINNILNNNGYRLSEPDGTHHRSVYYTEKGNADITITDANGNIISAKLVLNWKQVDTGLGWKIDVKLK